MTLTKSKLRAQVKSRFYYIFWGAATVSVFAGQVFVGCGFRRMAQALDDMTSTISIVIDPEFLPESDSYSPYYQEDMVVK